METLLEHLRALVAIDTTNPPRRIPVDGELVRYLRQALAGFVIEVEDYGDGHLSFYARRGNPEVLFNVHLDTVPVTSGWRSDPLRLEIREQKAYGRGACDIKGAAAVLLSLAQQTDASMGLLFTTDEEGAGGCAVANFLRSGKADGYRQVVVAEPTSTRAVLEHRGYLSVFGTFYGEGGHSSSAVALSASAIHRMGLWLGRALEIAAARRGDERDPGVCFNVGRVEGGEKNNMIAESVKLSWSARVPPGESSRALYDELAGVAGDDPVDWRVSMIAPPLPAAGQDHQRSHSFAGRHDLVVGEPVDFWTEASLFSAHGLPALVLGPGDIAQAHTVDEWVSLAQLESCYSIYRRIIRHADPG